MAVASTLDFHPQGIVTQHPAELLYLLGRVTERNEDDTEDTHDYELMYDQLSEGYAALLRRMCSVGILVRSLNLRRISMSALKVAFDGVQYSALLEKLSWYRLRREGLGHHSHRGGYRTAFLGLALQKHGRWIREGGC